jgi:hypothetical protein
MLFPHSNLLQFTAFYGCGESLNEKLMGWRLAVLIIIFKYFIETINYDLSKKSANCQPPTANRSRTCGTNCQLIILFSNRSARNKPTRPGMLKIEAAGNAVHIEYFTCKK